MVNGREREKLKVSNITSLGIVKTSKLFFIYGFIEWTQILTFSLTTVGQIFSLYLIIALTTVASDANISSNIDNNLTHAKTFKVCTWTTLHKFGFRLNPEKSTFFAAEA